MATLGDVTSRTDEAGIAHVDTKRGRFAPKQRLGGERLLDFDGRFADLVVDAFVSFHAAAIEHASQGRMITMNVGDDVGDGKTHTAEVLERDQSVPRLPAPALQQPRLGSAGLDVVRP